MIHPDDRAKPSALSLREIEARMTPRQRRELRKLWREIGKSKLPARAYLDTFDMFMELLVEGCRDLHDSTIQKRSPLVERVVQRYAAVAWLERMGKS